MKIKDIIYGDKFSVWCKFNRNDAVQDMEGSIKYINDRLLFCNKNFHDEIEILDKTYKLSLDTNFARGYENFAYIRNKKDNKYLGATEKSKQLNSIYENLAKKYNCYFLSNDGLEAGVDRVHLTEESHKKLAELLYNKIKDIYTN